MQVHEIKREHPHKKAKLVARGGKRGKTAGRGGKGQTARAGNKRRPAMRDIIKKLPKLRGHGKNRSKSTFDRGPIAVVNVSQLEAFDVKTEITGMMLVTSKLVELSSGRMPTIKILGTGELTKALTVVGFAVSETAKAKIEKAGGAVTSPVVDPRREELKQAKAAKAAAKEPKAKAPKEASAKKGKKA
jgi:large subunit ribosomal protein L15